MGRTSPSDQPVTPAETATRSASTPPVYSGHQDHSFTLQAIMEMQKSIGELKAVISDTTSSINSMKSKVDNLVEWKNKILGGAIVLGAVITLATFLITKFSDYITIAPHSDRANQADIQKK